MTFTDGQILTAAELNTMDSNISTNTADIAAIDADLTLLMEDNAVQQIEIIELQADAGLTPQDSGTMISDTFSDSTGLNNTVDTGNTTATFDTNKYKRVNSSGSTEAHGKTQSSTDSGNGKTGAKITMTSTADLISIDVASDNYYSTKCYLMDSAFNEIASAPVVGITATFSTPQTLTSGTTYYVVGDREGGSYHQLYKIQNNPALYPIAGTILNWIAGYKSSDTSNTLYTIKSLTFGGSETNKTIRCDLPATISGTTTDTYLFVNTPDRESGDAVTYDLYDASGNHDDGLVTSTGTDSTKNTLSNVTGTDLGGGYININLTPKSSSPTTGYPSCKTYCLVLVKS